MHAHIDMIMIIDGNYSFRTVVFIVKFLLRSKAESFERSLNLTVKFLENSLKYWYIKSLNIKLNHYNFKVFYDFGILFYSWI